MRRFSLEYFGANRKNVGANRLTGQILALTLTNKRFDAERFSCLNGGASDSKNALITF